VTAELGRLLGERSAVPDMWSKLMNAITVMRRSSLRSFGEFGGKGMGMLVGPLRLGSLACEKVHVTYLAATW
jgi:hypothetical protein